MNPLDLIPAPYNLIAKIGLPVIAVVGVWIAGDVHGHHAQSKSDAAALSAEHARAEGFKANQETLTAALNRQNAAVVALKVDGDKRVADGKTALAQAQRVNAGLSDQAAALRRSAGRKIGKDDPCVISNTLGNVGAI